jgi:UDP-2,4-diacetamido-2,4,6-trideoxy-beta-L-altropyranose hydrolase
MIKKIALFRAEASLEIGTGHVMRCMVLADLLTNLGWKCSFISSQKSYDLISKLNQFARIEPEKIWNNPTEHELLIVDNYSLDESYENHFRDYAKKILVIDDLANRKHNCDFLLDQNLGTKIEDYKNLVNSDCKILAGTNYCLLRPEFAKLRPAALQKRSQTKIINKILVNFGGSDVNNHSEKALEEIEKSDFWGKVEVALGFNAPHFKKIQHFAKNSKNKITIHKQTDMAQLIFEADLAIAAGGTSAWERCCLGLPTYIVKIADNQEKIFRELGSADDFNKFYLKLLDNYQAQVKKIANYVDGKGANRVMSSIIQ